MTLSLFTQTRDGMKSFILVLPDFAWLCLILTGLAADLFDAENSKKGHSVFVLPLRRRISDCLHSQAESASDMRCLVDNNEEQEKQAG